MSKIGYARVSTRNQNLDRQIDALKEHGCERVFSEKVSGKKYRRTELDNCLDYLRDGDTLVILDLYRLGRTTKQLIELAQFFQDNNINLEIISMNINTNDAMGKMFFTMMSAFGELEADLLSERTKSGLASARARGRTGGRPKTSKTTEKMVLSLYDSKNYTINDITKMTYVSKGTIYRIINDRKKANRDN